MISEIKNTPPRINFSFGKTNTTIAVGSPVTVWLSRQYNEVKFNYAVQATGATAVNPISNFQYQITYGTPGVYTLYAQLTEKTTGKTTAQALTSNILTLTVV